MNSTIAPEPNRSRQPIPSPWKDIRHPLTGRLMCKYDPQRQLLEVKDKKSKAVIDLKQVE